MFPLSLELLERVRQRTKPHNPAQELYYSDVFAEINNSLVAIAAALDEHREQVGAFPNEVPPPADRPGVPAVDENVDVAVVSVSESRACVRIRHSGFRHAVFATVPDRNVMLGRCPK